MLYRKIVDLYFDLFEKGSLSELYTGATYSKSMDSVGQYGRALENRLSSPHTVYLVKYVPKYLNFNLKKRFLDLKSYEEKGYAIDLEQIPNIDAYIKTYVKPRFRGTIRSNLRRLESCFKIDYHIFHGKIAEHEYDLLMDALHGFITRRFLQRNETNQRIGEWDRFHSLFNLLIKEKKASMFVIYSEKKPIAISLNYHFDKIFFNAIPSYDIDYGKFGLGHIMIYRQLEWCIQNELSIFDMSMGTPEYKMKWCNMAYDFEHHIVYNSASLSAYLHAQLFFRWTSLKKYLKSKNIHVLYKRLKAGLSRKSRSDKNTDVTQERFAHWFESVDDLSNHGNLTRMDLDQQYNSFLKMYVHEFLYKTKEHISNVGIYEIERERLYLIKGEKHAQKLVLREITTYRMSR